MLLLLTLACGTPSCEPVPWSDVELVAEDDGLRAYTEQVLAEFASWSGTDEVCLDTLTLGVVEEPKRSEGFEARGRYSVWKQDIVVEPDSPDLYGDLFHELCHALDATSGYTLGEGGDLDVDDLPDYYTGWHAVTEAFSEACESGPDDVGRYVRWRDECGLDVPDLTTVQYVTDAAFPAAPRADWESPTFAVETRAPWQAPSEIDGHWTYEGSASAGDAIALLYSTFVGDRWGVRFADPVTGVELAWWEEAESQLCGGPCALELVPSPEGAWLQVFGDDVSWRRLEGRAFVPADIPCIARADFVADGAVWWNEAHGNAVDLRRCDMTTGAVEAVERPPAPGPDPLRLDWASVVPTERGAAFRHEGVGLSWPTESGWQSVALPEHLAVSDVLFRGDDAILAIHGHAMTETDFTTALARLDLRDGTLHAPTTACVATGSGRPWFVGVGDIVLVGTAERPEGAETTRIWFTPVVLP